VDARSWVLTDCAMTLHLELRMAALTTEDPSARPDPDRPVMRAIRELLSPTELVLVEQVAAGTVEWEALGATSEGERPEEAGPTVAELLHRRGGVVSLEDWRL
jgi:hypothetical protein